MSKLTQLRPGLWAISHPFLGEEEIYGSYLLAGNGELAIIDPGPGSIVEALLGSIREAGFDPRDVTHILATHVHLDHAGNAGTLVRLMPRSKVYVHGLGAPHLLDPTRIVTSATRIFGDRMKLWWGEIEPVPYERLRVIEQGDTLNVAGCSLEVHYTPGHALHHVSFLDMHSGEAFVGDTAGVRLPGVPYVRPPTPPPDIDLEAWSASIELLNNLHPELLYIGHYGAIRDIEPHLAELKARLYAWGDFVLAAMRDGKEEAEILYMLVEHTKGELLRTANGDQHALDRYEIATNYMMTVQGYMRYWKLTSQKR